MSLVRRPLILEITESPNRRIAEALILTESRIARRCRAIRRDSTNPGSRPPEPQRLHPCAAASHALHLAVNVDRFNPFLEGSRVRPAPGLVSDPRQKGEHGMESPYCRLLRIIATC